jgi:Uma2 family endonuclease
MTPQAEPGYAFDDYLTIERSTSDSKHEFIAGHVYAMTGASFQHNLIVANLVAELRLQFKQRPCAVLSNDMRVRIEQADAVTYPDIVALCEQASFYSQRSDVLLNPALLVEVLSPSTEAYDRGGKFALYRQIPSLREYVLIAQDRYSVEVFTRQDDGRWLLSVLNEPDVLVAFESIGCQIPLAEIYDKVSFALPGDARM